ncbi:MAG: hypothetical protein KDK51_01105 [Deltaproteobacteria bacterium]|nr:hypothetical protein [Deltaproteobacteria bacterium]
MNQTTRQQRAQRWNYLAEAVLISEGQESNKAKLFSISKSGILFQCHVDIDVGSVVEMTWQDPEVGPIQASFNIRAKAKSTDGQTTNYRARFYQVDETSKKSIISILHNLQSLKTVKQGPDIELIRQLVLLDTKVFSAYADQRQDPSSPVGALLENISPLAYKQLLGPESALDSGLQKIHMYHMQLSLVYRLILHAKSYSADEFSYGLDLCKNLLENYVLLENEDVAVLEPVHIHEDMSEDEVKAIEQQRDKNEKLIFIYKSTSNGFFDVAKKLIEYFESQQWLKKIIDTPEGSLQMVHAQAKVLVEYFYQTIDVKKDYISDMDLVLTQSAYEVEHNSPEQEPEAAPSTTHEQRIKNLKSSILLAVLLLVFAVLSWRAGMGVNLKDKYEGQLVFENAKITRINRFGDNLSIYIKSTNGNSMDYDGPIVQKALPVIYTFMQGKTSLNAVMLYDAKTKYLITAIPRFSQ